MCLVNAQIVHQVKSDAKAGRANGRYRDLSDEMRRPVSTGCDTLPTIDVLESIRSLGLRPGRRNSGKSEPQKGISKEGDRYLRTMMVQGAHYILGPFGEDSDLRRWGRKLAERGGKNAKKRAVVAVARKLAVLLHRLWVSGEVYEPLRNSQKAMRAVA